MKIVQLCILAAVIGGSAAQAQVTIVSDDRLACDQIQESFNAFAIYRAVRFEIQIAEGASALNKRLGYTEGWLAFDTISPKPAIRFELNEYVGAKWQSRALLRRLVGDGSTFFVYDAATNTYSVSRYAGRDLFRLIAKATRSTPSTLIGKLLLQVHGGPYPSFDPSAWLSRGTLVPAHKDDTYAFLQLGNSNVGETSYAFGLSAADRIVYTSRPAGYVGNTPSIDWELTTFKSGGALGNFRFSPPRNARQVGS